MSLPSVREDVCSDIIACIAAEIFYPSVNLCFDFLILMAILQELQYISSVCSQYFLSTRHYSLFPLFLSATLLGPRLFK